MREVAKQDRSAAFFVSWLSRAALGACVMGIAHLMVVSYTGSQLDNLYRWILLGAIIGTVYWMSRSWVLVIEGRVRHAEYGGTENRLQRLHFHDRKGYWELKKPLPVVLDNLEPPGCMTFVSVWEDFLGDNRIMFRTVNMYTGENVVPDDAEQW